MATNSVAPGSGARNRRRGPLQLVESALVAGADYPVLLTPGEYQAVGGVGRVYQVHRTRKVRVPWQVLVPDGETETGMRVVVLYRYYPADEAHSRPGSSSALLREWIVGAGRRPRRGDRLSLRVWHRGLFRVVVRTVDRDHRQRVLSQALKYSVVDQVIARLTGGVPS